MEKLIKEALDNYFSDFKQYHLIILILFTILITLIQVIQSIVVTKKLERFKNQLKKSEIKFSKFNELQVTALTKLHISLVNLNTAYNSVFKPKPEDIGHVNYKNRINTWINTYYENSHEFTKEKIFLTIKMKELYIKAIEDFKKINELLLSEKRYIEMQEEEYYGDWGQIYEYEQREVEEISNRIHKLNQNESVSTVYKHIRNLRKSIEELFEGMN